MDKAIQQQQSAEDELRRLYEEQSHLQTQLTWYSEDKYCEDYYRISDMLADLQIKIEVLEETLKEQ